MARQEDDREDLIREATALNPRVEWEVPGEPDPVFTGLKRDGSLAIYFGQAAVYQFNSEGQLRRAWIAGFLYRTQGVTLARMHRERTGTATYLLRVDLSEAELKHTLDQMDQRLTRLKSALQQNQATVLREVCAGQQPDFAVLIERALTSVNRLAPAIPGRR